MTCAESLMALAEAFLRSSPRGELLIAPPRTHRDPGAWERARIALAFRNLPPVIQFRAIVEEWDYDQCKGWTL